MPLPHVYFCVKHGKALATQQRGEEKPSLCGLIDSDLFCYAGPGAPLSLIPPTRFQSPSVPHARPYPTTTRAVFTLQSGAGRGGASHRAVRHRGRRGGVGGAAGRCPAAQGRLPASCPRHGARAPAGSPRAALSGAAPPRPQPRRKEAERPRAGGRAVAGAASGGARDPEAEAGPGGGWMGRSGGGGRRWGSSRAR